MPKSTQERTHIRVSEFPESKYTSGREGSLFFSRSKDERMRYLSTMNPLTGTLEYGGLKFRSQKNAFQAAKFGVLDGEPRPDLQERFAVSGRLADIDPPGRSSLRVGAPP